MNKDYDFSKLGQVDYDQDEMAIFASSLPRELQIKLFQEMKDNDVKRVIQSMSNLKTCSRERVNQVLKKFYDLLSEEDELIFNENKGRDFLWDTVGEDRAKWLFGENAHVDTNQGLESLELVDNRTLGGFLLNEHPQTISLVIAHLDSSRKADVLRRLPEGLQAEVVLRIANLDYVSPELISQLDDVLKTELGTLGMITDTEIGGVAPLADMLNLMTTNEYKNIMSRVEERDPELARELENLMFTFDQIVLVDDKGIQNLLRETDNELLVLALKNASPEITDKIFKNMTIRGATLLKEDLETVGPIKLSEVEKARQNLINKVRGLESQGKAYVLKKASDTYV